VAPNVNTSAVPQASLAIRVRHPSGAFTLRVQPDSSLEALLTAVRETTGLAVTRLLHGFPPAALRDVRELRNGDSVTAVAEDAPVAVAAPPVVAQSEPHSAPVGVLNGVCLPGGEAVVRRLIASDNSCLFNAVGYVTQHSRSESSYLRELIASHIAAEQETYSEAVLGKPSSAYCDWLLKPDSWGGAIELSILSQLCGLQIDAADIQTCRVDRYGESGGFQERVLLLYDGLHYDAVALAASLDAPEDFDRTVLPLLGDEVDAAFAALVKSQHDARQFTNTATFSLRCLVCREGLVGQKEAAAHALKTGHASFGEY